jgi:predicted transcriptional regulator
MAEAAATPGPIYRPPAYALLEQDLKDIATLAGTGIPRNQATVLITLHRYGKGVEITSRWIERVADLRQPEVSIAMADLILDNIVTTSENKALSKGRPVKVYHVKGNIPKYIRDKIGERMTELNKGVMAVNRIFAAKGAEA